MQYLPLLEHPFPMAVMERLLIAIAAYLLGRNPAKFNCKSFSLTLGNSF